MRRKHGGRRRWSRRRLEEQASPLRGHAVRASGEGWRRWRRRWPWSVQRAGNPAKIRVLSFRRPHEDRKRPPHPSPYFCSSLSPIDQCPASQTFCKRDLSWGGFTLSRAGETERVACHRPLTMLQVRGFLRSPTSDNGAAGEDTGARRRTAATPLPARPGAGVRGGGCPSSLFPHHSVTQSAAVPIKPTAFPCTCVPIRSSRASLTSCFVLWRVADGAAGTPSAAAAPPKVSTRSDLVAASPALLSLVCQAPSLPPKQTLAVCVVRAGALQADPGLKATPGCKL